MKPGTIPSISITDAHTDVVTVSHLPEVEVELSALNMGEINISHTTILDGGSDSNIFNFYYLHLFTRLEPHRGSLSGVGGPVANIITHKGIVEFLGVHLVAYYSHNISKSVVSEGVLANNNFSINKYANLCIITNLKNGLSTTTQLVNLVYPLPVELFTHDTECHHINLASVRPSNPRTLWHGRFGHGYMGTTIKMAKMPLYRDRGLLIPTAFLHNMIDEDLCDACALGKPTLDNSFDTHYRSTTKGQLWYVDVSGGGHLTPSLKYGNKYMYLFADSATRMYFKNSILSVSMIS
jgi:hypothetical protein